QPVQPPVAPPQQQPLQPPVAPPQQQPAQLPPVEEEIVSPAYFMEPTPEKPKVTGLSPYVENPEPAPSRGMKQLPPSKNAAAKSTPVPEPKPEPVAPTLPGPMPETYNPVAPGPPVPGWGAPKQVQATGSEVNQPSVPQAPQEPSMPSGRAELSAQPNLPVQSVQAPGVPVPPPELAPSSSQGHEYKAGMDIAALHALRGNSAYLDPMIQNRLAPASHTGVPLCPSCGNHLEANARFCGECGYSLPARVLACSGCNNPLEAGAKFCGECGTAVLQSGQAEASGSASDKGKAGWMVKFLKFLEN
ncbi:MAG: zinc ribbon domain-containing protein, partial [Candidatus Obscuribacterales bacterium]|nr:zinc ribbon domain-containing protein [Candidatus Obscuribacterales bacterium]